MNTFRIVVSVATALLTANFTFAQTWTQTIAPTNNYWFSIASSADGSRLAALGQPTTIDFSAVYTSTNSGTTWISNSLPATRYGQPAFNFEILAGSADGTQLVAAQDNDLGIIDTSTNWGLTWVTRTNYGDTAWTSAASSTDGKTLVLSDDVSRIRISTNSGATWSSLQLPGYISSYAASPANGSSLVVAVNGAGIYGTTNFGSSWITNNLSTPPLSAIAASADGIKLAVVASMGQIDTSANSGITWVQQTNAPSLPWSSVASSADGTKLVAVAGGFLHIGPIYTSTDSGVTWISNSAPVTNWISVASSADGRKLVATVFSGGIWTAQTTPAPSLNIAPTNGNLTLSWIIPSTNFMLQQNLDLTTANWTEVTNWPVLNLTNLQDEVTLPLTNGGALYRLVAQ